MVNKRGIIGILLIATLVVTGCSKGIQGKGHLLALMQK
jgi:predicted small secreted protein